MMRTVGWPEFLADWPIESKQMIFLDLGLFDISATITAAVRQIAKHQMAEAVSIHHSCIRAAFKGQIEGKPLIVTRKNDR